MNDVWSDDWVNKTLKSFNVRGEMEWDKCDICNTLTHIHVAKWQIIEEKTQLLCKKCQKYDH